MELLLGRNQEVYHGLSLNDQNGEAILRIDGKKEDNVPVLLLSVDAHTVYGLSHPKVITRILHNKTPNLLYTSKKNAHTLFEHGMKSSVGYISLGKQKFQTSIETWYDIKFQGTLDSGVEITVFTENDICYAKLSYKNTSYILSNDNLSPKTDGIFINISMIRDYVNLVFDESETNTIDSSGAGCP